RPRPRCRAPCPEVLRRPLPGRRGAVAPAVLAHRGLNMSGAIALYARETPGFGERVAHARTLLRGAAGEHGGRIVLASSLGAEDMVLTDLIARDRLPIAVGTLQTGKLHAQTLELVRRTEQHYGMHVEL